jgi:hypothetical protein
MPLNLPNRIVSLHDVSLPSQPSNADLPKNPQLMNLIGGAGGDAGEKSYKPKIQFSLGLDVDSQSSSPLDVQTNTPYYTKEIKEENDCGHAIKILHSNTNKSEVNIEYLNPTSGVNIYITSNQLPFSSLNSGVAQSKTAGTNLTNGTSVNNFSILTNGTETVSVIQDTELGLNKNYLDLTSSNYGDVGTKFLKLNVSSATDADSIYNVFVSEIDVNQGYVSCITSSISPSSLSYTATTTLTVSIQSAKLFSNGDVIRIQDLSDNSNFAIGTVSSYASTNLVVVFNKQINAKDKYLKNVLPIGSSVSIEQINDWDKNFSNCISTFFTDSSNIETVSTLRNKFNVPLLNGLRFKHQRQITNNHIIDYNNRFSYVSNNFSQTSAETELTLRNLKGDPNFNIYRIGDRDYLKSQYVGRDQLISKNKFSIISYGFYKQNNVFNYFQGHYKNIKIYPTAFPTLLSDPKSFLFILGVSSYNNQGVYKPYYTHKLYEVLCYKNLQYLNTGQPQSIIVDYLIQKYKEKAFFGNNTEIQTADNIYYSQADRPNIFGKVRKIVS